MAVRGRGLVTGEGEVPAEGGMSQVDRGWGGDKDTAPLSVITIEGGAGDPRAFTVATDKRGERGWPGGAACRGEVSERRNKP